MTRREECMTKFNNMSADMKAKIDAGIENNRKGSAKITFRDKNGVIAAHRNVKITQKKHSFLYGANLFMLDELETEEKNNIFKKTFPEVFNQATLPFYWSDLERVEGKPRFAKDSPRVYRRPAPDLCLEYCSENGITPKEHCLTYITWQPEWLDAKDTNVVKAKLEKRYRELSERYSDKIYCWEVINELLCAAQEGNYNNPFFNDDDILEWNFALAEKYFPNNQLVINEAPFLWLRPHFAYNRSSYYMIIERAIKNGARIDAIGMQFHVFNKDWEKYMYDPELLYEVLDKYSDFNLPIQITEITVPAYSGDEEDENLQADLIENLYTLWFSHKSVEMITYWNAVDGYAAWAPQGDMTKGENVFFGGLMRFDLSKKPAFDRIKYLFNEKWHTDLSIETDNNGEVSFRGFYGDYEAEIDGKTYSFSIHKDSENSIEIAL